jgi:PPOX class probable F420-dependent enzyme
MDTNNTPAVELGDKVRSFLQEARFAVAATINEDGSPHQTTMWYELQGGRIMMNTRVGRIKEKNLRRDPRISFCVEDGYSYITLLGRAELDYDPERSQAGIKALATRYEGPEEAERMVRNTFGKQQRVNIYMTIEAVDDSL